MKSIRVRKCGQTVIAWLLVTIVASSPFARAGEKLKPEEVVARHRESIGAAETRASIKSRIITGTVVATFRAPGTGQVGGRVVLASHGEKSMVGMIFDNSTNYPHEKIGFDGKDVSVSYVRPGVRSTLGDFLLTHKTVVSLGLLGGALSESWPLSNLSEKKGRLESDGTKKIGDRQAYEIKYFPRGGSDLRVSLFFDAQTFRHVRTEYARTLSAQMGTTPDASARRSETRYKMVEDFSEFGKEGGLTLPHKYKIYLELTGQGGSFRAEWEMTFSGFSFNQRIDPNSFDVDGN
ncbi:MAG: hypothetical protein ACRD68_06100 [Pyrinomonadaceae bacterium]